MLRRLPALLLISSLMLLSMGVASAAAAPALKVGIEQNGGMDVLGSRTEILDTQRGLGAGIIRFQLRFDQVAKCDPSTRAGGGTSYANACYDWSTPDAVVQGANQRGVQVLLSIYGAPKWEFNRNFNWTGETDAQFNAFSADYADFAQAAAQRYDGKHGMPRVAEWTIWNEPNGSYFFEPRFDANKNLIGPQRYARMYDASARRIKAIDPSLLVAVGPTAPMPRDLPPLTWARAALPVLQSLGSPIDAWAHNGYMGSQAPFNTTLKDPVVGLGNINDLTTLIDSFAITANKPVWITEFGYQTPPSAQSSVSPELQSTYLGEAFYFAWAHPRISTIIWYSLGDDGGADNPGAFQAGLYYQSGRCGTKVCPKPSARNFQHTIYVAPVKAGNVYVWGQGRVDPKSTRVFLRRAGGAWQAFANADTASTGTAAVTLAYSAGMQVMVCDTSCGELRTVNPPAAGGGVAKAKVVRKKLVGPLSLASALKRGIALPVRGRATATMIAIKGRSSGIPAARKKAFTTSKATFGKVGVYDAKLKKVVYKPGLSFKLNPATKRALKRVKRSYLTIRVVTTDAAGATTITYQPILLKR
ncbi:MAG: hypothetical protein JWN72_845 [Thermoleophilia bacterium]|nr:hypothetical protein [Thermoleophilia bacterium]